MSEPLPLFARDTFKQVSAAEVQVAKPASSPVRPVDKIAEHSPVLAIWTIRS